MLKEVGAVLISPINMLAFLYNSEVQNGNKLF